MFYGNGRKSVVSLSLDYTSSPEPTLPCAFRLSSAGNDHSFDTL